MVEDEIDFHGGGPNLLRTALSLFVVQLKWELPCEHVQRGGSRRQAMLHDMMQNAEARIWTSENTSTYAAPIIREPLDQQES